MLYFLVHYTSFFSFFTSYLNYNLFFFSIRLKYSPPRHIYFPCFTCIFLRFTFFFISFKSARYSRLYMISGKLSSLPLALISHSSAGQSLHFPFQLYFFSLLFIFSHVTFYFPKRFTPLILFTLLVPYSILLPFIFTLTGIHHRLKPSRSHFQPFFHFSFYTSLSRAQLLDLFLQVFSHSYTSRVSSLLTISHKGNDPSISSSFTQMGKKTQETTHSHPFEPFQH